MQFYYAHWQMKLFQKHAAIIDHSMAVDFCGNLLPGHMHDMSAGDKFFRFFQTDVFVQMTNPNRKRICPDTLDSSHKSIVTKQNESTILISSVN